MEERRSEVRCDFCGTNMKFTKRITPPVEEVGGLIYRCPTRKNEGGCGRIKEVLFYFSPYGQEIFV